MLLRGFSRQGFSLVRTAFRNAESVATQPGAKQRVLVPLLFRERVIDGESVYKFNPIHHKEDLEAYKKQIEMQHQDVSLLDFMEEGEEEATVSGKNLFARYGKQLREDDEEKAKLFKMIKEGQDVIPEHPADIINENVASKNKPTFQECWQILQAHERNRLVTHLPRKSVLLNALQASRTRRHFTRALRWLHVFDKSNISWTDGDKSVILNFCDKHDYPNFILPKLQDPYSKFYPKLSHYEQTLRILLRMGRIGDAYWVDNHIRTTYKQFSHYGYHIGVQYWHISGGYEKCISVFQEFLATSPKPFSLALWEHLFKSLILAGKTSELKGFTDELLNRGMLRDFHLKTIVLGFVAEQDFESAKAFLDRSENPTELIDSISELVDSLQQRPAHPKHQVDFAALKDAVQSLATQ